MNQAAHPALAAAPASSANADASPPPNGATFIHRPRPPFVYGKYQNQRYYGNDDFSAIDGLRGRRDTRSKARVYRLTPDDAVLLEMHINWPGDDSSAELGLIFNAAGARELAARLIDAAHDIDCEAATQKQEAAA